MWDHAPPGQDQGAFHASEIPYVLNTLWSDTNSDWETVDYQVATIVSSYWANFISTHNPCRLSAKHYWASKLTSSTETGDPNKGGAYKEYYGMTNLTTWPVTRHASNTTFNIGDSYKVDYLASPAQIALALAWFHNYTTVPY